MAAHTFMYWIIQLYNLVLVLSIQYYNEHVFHSNTITVILEYIHKIYNKQSTNVYISLFLLLQISEYVLRIIYNGDGSVTDTIHGYCVTMNLKNTYCKRRGRMR